MTEKYSWIPIYTEIANKLQDYEKKQPYLISLLKEMKDAGFKTISIKDEDKPNHKIDLEEIDPFTFFANFNRATIHENKYKILTFLKDKLDLKSNIPTDFNGVPTVNNQKSWFFSYNYERKKDDIPKLWEFFRQSLNSAFISGSIFNNVLKIKGVKTNITIGLFWIKPDVYLPLDANTQKFLKNQITDVTYDNTYESYKAIIEKAHGLKMPFYELSHKAFGDLPMELSTELPTLKLLAQKSQIIFYGPPGTGKTYKAREISVNFIKDTS